MKTKTEIVDRLIQSVGMRTFVKYYDDFKYQSSVEKMLSIFKKNNEKWKENPSKTMFFKSKIIFAEKIEKEVLNKIIKSNPNRIGFETIEKAKQLLIRIE